MGYTFIVPRFDFGIMSLFYMLNVKVKSKRKIHISKKFKQMGISEFNYQAS